MCFAERLKTLREQHNMTQEELARKLNITRQAVGNYEQGTRFPKDEKTLKTIADLFDISLDDLFGRDYSPKLYPQAGNDILNLLALESQCRYEAERVTALKELIYSVDNLPLDTIYKIKKAVEVFTK